MHNIIIYVMYLFFSSGEWLFYTTRRIPSRFCRF